MPWTNIQSSAHDIESTNNQETICDKTNNDKLRIVIRPGQIVRADKIKEIIVKIEKPAVEAFVADLKAVCEKHGLFIQGVCLSEGIEGEIQICTRSTISPPSKNHSGNEDDIYKPFGIQEDPDWYIDGVYPSK